MEYPDREEEELSVLNKDKYYALTEKSFYKKLGKVTKIVGLTIESAGPDAKLNDLCKIYSADKSQVLYAEVVGFKDSRVLLMPFDVVDGIGPGSIVEKQKVHLLLRLVMIYLDIHLMVLAIRLMEQSFILTAVIL